MASFLASTRDWLLAAFSRENETEADDLVSFCDLGVDVLVYLFVLKHRCTHLLFGRSSPCYQNRPHVYA